MFKLTGKVLISKDQNNKGYKEFSKKLAFYGVTMSKETFKHMECDIDTFFMMLGEKAIKEGEASKTLFTDWNTVLVSDIEDLYFQTLTHYFSTYGQKSITGKFDPDYVYLPEGIRKVSGYSKLKVIHGISKNDAISEILELAYKNIAFNDDTLKELFSMINYLNIKIELDKILNKELQVIMMDKLNLIPLNAEQFFRFWLFKHFNKTLLIKNDETIKYFKDLADYIPKKNLEELGLEILAQDFYRFKPFFLALKSNPDLKSVINKISKLARTYHKPKITPDYLQLTSKNFSKSEFINIISNMDTSYLIKLYRAFKIREEGNILKYRIRNGKTWLKKSSVKPQNIKKIKFIKELISERVSQNIEEYDYIYIPKGLDLALPTSGKQFIGDIPIGSKIPLKSKDIVVGIYWENNASIVDLDLSLTNDKEKIGWDGDFRNSNILFSGDITDGTNGATELFYISSMNNDMFLISVNNYTSYDNPEIVNYKMFLANEHVKPKKGISMASLSKINSVTALKTDHNNAQQILGFITDKYFIFTNEKSAGQTAKLAGKELLDFNLRSISSYLSILDIVSLDKVTHNPEKKGKILKLDNLSDILRLV
jgi:hypothetical protein